MGVGAAIVGAGALGAAGSVASGMIGAGAAGKAASLQAQQQQYQRQVSQPFISAGTGVLPNLTALATGSPTGGGPDYVSQAAGLAPPQMSEAWLQQTPGYQFQVDQGLKQVQSSAAARGLGISGAAMKGAAGYVQGLADQTYGQQFALQQQRFQNAIALNTAQQSNLQNQFSRLQNVASLGANTATGAGTIEAQLAGQQGQALMAQGQALGQGISGATNALAQGIGGYAGYNLAQKYLGQGGNLSPATLANLQAQWAPYLNQGTTSGFTGNAYTPSIYGTPSPY